MLSYVGINFRSSYLTKSSEALPAPTEESCILYIDYVLYRILSCVPRDLLTSSTLSLIWRIRDAEMTCIPSHSTPHQLAGVCQCVHVSVSVCLSYICVCVCVCSVSLSLSLSLSLPLYLTLTHSLSLCVCVCICLCVCLCVCLCECACVYSM